MFFRLSIVFILSLSLVANDKDHNKNELLVKYSDALKLYKLKEYQKSYTLFNQLFQIQLDNANINFYLGRSAFELKKYHEAIIAYEQILFNEPESLRTKFELAKTYFMYQKFEESKYYFQELYKDDKTPTHVKESIDEYLAIIDTKIQKHFLNGIFLVGLNYDSNVNSRSNYDLYNIPNLPNPAVNSVDDESDLFHEEVILLNHRYNKNDTMIFKNDFVFYSKTMNNHKNSAQDIDMVSYNPMLHYTYNDGLFVDYSIFIDALWIDDKSNLNTYGLMPKFTYTIDKNTITKGYFKYQIKKNKLDDTKINDSTYFEINNDWQFVSKIGTPYGVSFVYSNEQQDNKQVNNTIDKKSFNISANSTYIFNNSLSLLSTLSYKYTKYDQNDIFYLKKRTDDEYKLTLMGTYIYSQNWLLQFGTNYTDNHSNLQPNVYDKYTFKLNIIRTF